MFEMTIPQMIKMLKNLDAILDKANAYADTKKFDVNNLLTARLAPDQFAFLKQVQIVCDAAKFCAARLSGQTPPKHEDNEKTLSELKARIQSVVSYLQGFKPSDFNGYEERKILPPWANGKHLMGKEWVIENSIPNFYFHMVTAYAILRHNGLDIGKADYIGSLALKD